MTQIEPTQRRILNHAVEDGSITVDRSNGYDAALRLHSRGLLDRDPQSSFRFLPNDKARIWYQENGPQRVFLFG